MESFLLITGPKTDLWLVETVGGLVGVIGFVLLVGSRERPPGHVVLLAVASAAVLLLIDVVYTVRERIRSVYLADAVIEGLLIAGHMAAFLVRGQSGRPQLTHTAKPSM